MKKPLKLLSWVVVLAVTISLVTVFSSGGCRPAAPVEEPVVEEPVVEEPLSIIDIAKKYEGTTLKIAAVSWPTWDNLKARIPEFEQQTGINVEVAEIPYHEYIEKMLITLGTKRGEFDLIHINGDWMPMLTTEGLIEPINDYMVPEYLAPDFNYEDFIESTKEAFDVDGQIYGFPFEAGVFLIYYRKDLFDQFGLEFPKDWDELLDVAKTLTLDTDDDGTIDIYGWSIPAKRTAQTTWEFFQMLWSFGGEVLDEDNNPTFNGPEGIKALQYLVDLKNKHNVVPEGILEFTYDDQATLFLEGKLAMATSWSYVQDLADDPEMSKVVGNWWLAPRPGTGWAGVWAFGVPSDSKNKEAAFLLSQYLTSYDSIKGLALAGVPTTRKSVMEDPNILEKNEYLGPIVEAIANSKGPAEVSSPYLEQIADVIALEVSEALLLQKTPQEALDDAAEEVGQILKK